MFKHLRAKALLASILILTGTGTALADPFSWIYGKSADEATAELENQGFVFVRQGEDDGEKKTYYWIRKSYCVKFSAVDDVVSDAEEKPTEECSS